MDGALIVGKHSPKKASGGERKGKQGAKRRRSEVGVEAIASGSEDNLGRVKKQKKS